MRYFVVTISVAVITAVVAGALYFWLTMVVSRNEAQIASNKNEVQTYGAAAVELESLLKAKNNIASRQKAVDRLTSVASFKVDSLAEFSFLIPHDVWLTQLSYQRGQKEIKIKGESSSESGISQFVDNLISSAKFTQVLQRSINKSASAMQPTYAFVIDCKLGEGQ